MKTHLSFPTRDLATSVAFYQTLLNTAPLKHYDDYALFISDKPGIELALSHADNVAVDPRTHFGIAATETSAVDDAVARLTAAGLPVDIERGETCCYAKQNKVWATDPDGRRWEVYYVLEETQERDADARCCTEETCDTHASCCAA